MRIVRHPLEVFLIGETHPRPVAACGDDFRAGLDYGVGCPVIGTPGRQVGIVAKSHHAGRVGLARNGQFLDRYLRLAVLPAAAEGHQHRTPPDRGIEHLDQSLLGGHVGRGEQLLQPRLQRGARVLPAEGIVVLNRKDGRRSVMPCAGAVDETARQVGHAVRAVEDLHPPRIRDIGHIRDLDVLFCAISLETRAVGSRDDHGHPLLRLADGEFHGIEAAVFGRNAVEVDFQTVGQFADGHAHAACPEVVRFLDEPGDLRPAEQPLELTFFRRIAFLDFAAAGAQRSTGVPFRRTGGAADAVAARPAAEHQDHVARQRSLAQHLVGRHGADHGTHLHPFGRVARMENLPHMRGRQADLVAIARIAGRRLATDDTLRQFARQRLTHRFPDVAGAGHAHRLIDVGPAGKRVADGTAQTGRCPAERLDLGGMVMGLVLELQQPFFCPAVHIRVDHDAAGIVFLALFLVVQHAFVLQVTGADGSQFHQAEGLVFPPKFPAHGIQPPQVFFQRRTDERILHPDVRQAGRKRRVAAVVAPIGVQNVKFRLGGIAPLPAEMQDHFSKVVGVHRQSPFAAEGGEVLLFHGGEAVEPGQRPDLGIFFGTDHRQVFLPAFHSVDEVFPDGGKSFFRKIVVKDQQAAAADAHFCGRIKQVDAVERRSGPLVELAREVFHSQVAAAFQIDRVGDGIGHALSEYGIAASLQQLVAEAAQVVEVDQPQAAEVNRQILIEFFPETFSLYPERGFLFDEDTAAFHQDQSSVLRTLSAWVCRKISRRAARSGSFKARIATA